MIPNSVGAVVAFLLLAAPGALYYLLRSPHAPATRETALGELSRVVLASLAATALAAMTLSWMWLNIYRATQSAAAFAPVQVGLGVVATSSLACGLVTLLSWWKWGRRPVSSQIVPGRVWYQAMVSDRPTKACGRPYLTVELVDGTGMARALLRTGRRSCRRPPKPRYRSAAGAAEARQAGLHAHRELHRDPAPRGADQVDPGRIHQDLTKGTSSPPATVADVSLRVCQPTPPITDVMST